MDFPRASPVRSVAEFRHADRADAQLRSPSPGNLRSDTTVTAQREAHRVSVQHEERHVSPERVAQGRNRRTLGSLDPLRKRPQTRKKLLRPFVDRFQDYLPADTADEHLALPLRKAAIARKANSLAAAIYEDPSPLGPHLSEYIHA